MLQEVTVLTIYKNNNKIKTANKNHYVSWTELSVCKEYNDQTQSEVRKEVS